MLLLNIINIATVISSIVNFVQLKLKFVIIIEYHLTPSTMEDKNDEANLPTSQSNVQQIGAEGSRDTLLGPCNFPTRLSSVLKLTTSLTPAARQEFVRRSRELFAKRNKTNYEKEWLADYMENQDAFFMASETALRSRHSSRNSGTSSQMGDARELEYRMPPMEPPSHIHVPHREPFPNDEVVRPADLNKLFVKPETFNGIKPPPRQWLDQYEKAAFSNGWTETAKIKYMATFLKETAYS